MKKEQVNHPEHYKDENGKECIDYMEDIFGKLCVFIFCLLNAYKYNFRKGKKDNNSEEQDLRKAQWYLNYARNMMIRFNAVERCLSRIVLKRFDSWQKQSMSA